MMNKNFFSQNRQEQQSKNLYTLILQNNIAPLHSNKFNNAISSHIIPKLQLHCVLGLNEVSALHQSQNSSGMFSHRNTRENTNNSNGVGCLFCLKLNEDSSLIASSAGETIKIYELQSGKLLHSLNSHTEIVTTLTWLHNNNNHFSNSQVNTLNNNSNSDHFNGNTLENSFLTASLDKTIKLWINYHVAATLKDHSGILEFIKLFYLFNLYFLYLF